MSFANQALAAEYIVRKDGSDLEPSVYGVPEEIDREIARAQAGDDGRADRRADRGAGALPGLLERGHVERRVAAPADIIRLETDAVVLLDQTRLPTELRPSTCHDVPAVWEAIRSLRGPRRPGDRHRRRPSGVASAAQPLARTSRRRPRRRRRGGRRARAPAGRRPSTCSGPSTGCERGARRPMADAGPASCVDRARWPRPARIAAEDEAIAAAPSAAHGAELIGDGAGGAHALQRRRPGHGRLTARRWP